MPPLTTEALHHAWLLGLAEAWEQARRRCPAAQPLRRPTLAISDTLQRRLGQWERRARRLTLAARLFRRGRWDDVLHVLHHEMAHQLADEALGARDETEHGPTFRRACALLGLDAAASMAVEEGDGELAEPEIVRRIHKLLALGESPNHHEAEAALAKARELFLKYNLRTLAEPGTRRYAWRIVGPAWRRVPAHVWSIVNIIGDFYFVEFICRPCADPGGEGDQRLLELYGTPENLDLAEYVFHFLLQQGEREWLAYRRERQLRGGRLRASFLAGLYQGFRQSLARQEARLSSSEALVWCGDPGLEAYFQQRNPRVRRCKVGGRIHGPTLADGAEVGARLRVRRPLHGDSSGPTRGLLE